jgi:hypothetical protein
MASAHGLRDKGAGEEQGHRRPTGALPALGVEARRSVRSRVTAGGRRCGGRIERPRFGNFLCGEGDGKAPNFVVRLRVCLVFTD